MRDPTDRPLWQRAPVGGFGFLPVASVLHDGATVDRLVEALGRVLSAVGGRRVGEEALAEPEPLVCVVLTGGTERRILDLWGRRQAAVRGEPIALVAHPGHNSLPAAMETLARLEQLGARGRILYLRGPDDEDGLASVAAAVHDLDVRRSLRASRIGAVGDPSDWLVASSPSAETVRAAWGPEVVRLDIGDVVRDHAARAPGEVRDLAASVTAGATSLRDVTEGDVLDAARLLPVLREAAARERLDAITVRCFDLIAELRTSACVALARLNDEGLIAGCEGDVVSAVGMLWVHRLLGHVPWMANPARVDPAGNAVLLAHCTVPTSLTSGYGLETHFESGLGVGVRGEPTFGDVTLARIGGSDMRRLWLAEGRVAPGEHVEGLCRTQVEVRLGRGSAADLLRAPLGNHLLVVEGHEADRLEAWWELMVRHPPEG